MQKTYNLGKDHKTKLVPKKHSDLVTSISDDSEIKKEEAEMGTAQRHASVEDEESMHYVTKNVTGTVKAGKTCK